jgi:hypothetical protein
MGKTHVIDGVTYVEIERMAKVGDYVLVTEFSNEIVREIRKVVRLSRYTGDFYIDEPIGRETYFDNNDDRYRTVEPVESEECCETPSVTDLLANLARRVSSLEQQLRDTQGNVEKLAEELANTKHRVSKHATMFGIVEERVGMLTERSQVLNAINKFYEEGSR